MFAAFIISISSLTFVTAFCYWLNASFQSKNPEKNATGDLNVISGRSTTTHFPVKACKLFGTKKGVQYAVEASILSTKSLYSKIKMETA